MLDLFYLAAIGAVMGFLAGFLGTGGGTLAIPALVIFFNYDQKLAQGTVLIMVILNVIKGFLGYKNYSKQDNTVLLKLALASSVFTLVGSALAFMVTSALLKKYYAVFLISLIPLIVASKNKLKLAVPLDVKWVIVPGVLGGITLGLFGVGGAMLTVPFLTMLFGYTQVKAQGAGLAVAVPGCILSFIPYLATNQINWPAALALSAASFLTVSQGVKAAHNVKEKTLIVFFCILLGVTGLMLLFK